MPSFMFDVLQAGLMFSGIVLLLSLAYLCHVIACYYKCAIVAGQEEGVE